MFSRDTRRRAKESILQKIGAHVSEPDEAFAEKERVHNNREQRLADVQRALSEYAVALALFSDAGLALATRFEALEDCCVAGDRPEDGTSGPSEAKLVALRQRETARVVAPATLHALRELADQSLAAAAASSSSTPRPRVQRGSSTAPEGREIAELLTMRREAHLDLDSFLSRSDPRADEGRRRVASLTVSCETEFEEFRVRVGAALERSIAAFVGCEGAYLARAADASTRGLSSPALSLDASRRTHATFSSAALALCAMNAAQLGRTSASLLLVDEAESACVAAHAHAAAPLEDKPKASPPQQHRRTNSVSMPGATARNTPSPPAKPLAIDDSPPDARAKYAAPLPKRPTPPPPPPSTPPPLELVVAVHTYVAQRDADLSFDAGDAIHVTLKKASGWWVGRKAAAPPDSRTGEFPSNYVRAATPDDGLRAP